MVVGLGTGRTTAYALEALAQRIKDGLRIVGIPTSRRAERLARRLRIPLATLAECPALDITIDGADEVEMHSFHLIKGLGGALLREKIVASATKLEIIVVDDSKLVERLGTKAPVPVEVLPFGWPRCQRALTDLGSRAVLRRRKDRPVTTDNGNYILDCWFGPISDPYRLEKDIDAVVGVLESGLFLDLAKVVVVGHAEGTTVHTLG